MPQRLRLAVLVLALAVAAPAVAPAPARAAASPGAVVEIKVPKSLIDWVKKNLAPLYIILDEIIDDLTGCHCPPPQPVPQPPDPGY